MARRSGYVVRTKTGERGRTYHDEPLVDGKQRVYVFQKGGEPLKMLCDPETLTVIGFAD